MEQQVEDNTEEYEPEDRRTVGPSRLREGDRPDDDDERRDDRRAHRARDATEKERCDRREERAEGDQRGPAPGVEDEREGDLAEPLAERVRLARYRAREDVGAEELAMVEHPLPAREMPVGVGIAGSVARGEHERRRGEPDGERVRGERAERAGRKTHGRMPITHSKPGFSR